MHCLLLEVKGAVERLKSSGSEEVENRPPLSVASRMTRGSL
jgi:hypothetical protein